MMELLEHLSILIRDTARSIPDLAERGKEVCQGADGTPTTQIDKCAENVVLSYLEENNILLNVLSEEIGFVDRGGERTLVLDPIDGTHNSMMGVPLYTASLAVGDESLRDVEYAYIRNLATDDVYMAEKGKGAFHNGRRIYARQISDKDNLCMILYLGCGAHPDTFKILKRCSRTRAYGCASIEMCLVAEGVVDGFLMNSEDPTRSIRVIDIAASHLILREAGGEIFTLDGELMDMPFDINARSNFLAVGDRRLKEWLL
ncbi:MAG: kinase [Candidatus Methanomethylophilaceae archaeon]|nr:kinase [Candidatus Methanomethylophilaceae archaeon]HIJ00946.1 hypothetical protein [Candidatus Methanomethylophilaceae archaeon]